MMIQPKAVLPPRRLLFHLLAAALLALSACTQAPPETSCPFSGGAIEPHAIYPTPDGEVTIFNPTDSGKDASHTPTPDDRGAPPEPGDESGDYFDRGGVPVDGGRHSGPPDNNTVGGPRDTTPTGSGDGGTGTGDQGKTPGPLGACPAALGAGVDVNSDGSFNYAVALQKAIYFYEAQRSGPLPAHNRVPWRGDSGMNDGSDSGVDLVGGWYDAGDHVKFGFPAAATTTLLAWTAHKYREALGQTGQLCYLLDNLKWGTDYFLKAHTAPNELWGQVGNGHKDHAWWGPAEVMPMERPSYKIDPSCPGSEIAGETAAALAASSLAFRPDMPDYADELLRHAKELYTFADEHRGDYHDCISDAANFYRSWGGYEDELVWGAAWLYAATGDTTYLDLVDASYEANASKTEWTLSWDSKEYSGYVLLAELTGNPKYKADAELFLDSWAIPGTHENMRYTDGGLAWLDSWGALRYSANTAMLAFIYSDYLESVEPGSELVQRYREFGERQINYMLGDNPHSRSYVVGYGSNPPKNPHHRTAHGSWANSLNVPEQSRHILYGALVGGPDSSDSYTDDRSDYVMNEVALDYNAGFVGSLAWLVTRYGGEPDGAFPPPETRDAEIFVEARVNAGGPRYVEISAMLYNRTAWPARVPDTLSFRYFVDLGEVFAAGYTLADVTVGTSYSNGGTVSELKPWDGREGDIYYVEVSFSGADLFPGGQGEHRKEIQFRMSLPYDSNEPAWDSQNDWSFAGLSNGSHSIAENVPVYEGDKLVFGSQP